VCVCMEQTAASSAGESAGCAQLTRVLTQPVTTARPDYFGVDFVCRRKGSSGSTKKSKRGKKESKKASKGKGVRGPPDPQQQQQQREATEAGGGAGWNGNMASLAERRDTEVHSSQQKIKVVVDR
jgi:hypothetical protein